MSSHVFANGQEIASKVSTGKSVAAFPDTCLSPPSPPAGPVPLPYPNTGEAKDLDKGSSKVLIKDKMIALEDTSYFSKSMGNEAATKSQGMGVITGTIQGGVYFKNWSMDVKVEGKGVPRNIDMTTHNHASETGEIMTIFTGLSDSYTRNLNNYEKKMGLEYKSGKFARHHIVEKKDEDAKISRGVLGETIENKKRKDGQKEEKGWVEGGGGIHIHAPENLVRLPNNEEFKEDIYGILHNTSHPSEYSMDVNDILKKAEVVTDYKKEKAFNIFQEDLSMQEHRTEKHADLKLSTETKEELSKFSPRKLAVSTALKRIAIRMMKVKLKHDWTNVLKTIKNEEP